MSRMDSNYTLRCLEDCGLLVVDGESDFVTYNLVLQGAVLPLIALFGLVGNGLSFYVFTRRDMLTTLSCYLSGLAVSDCLIILCSTFIFTTEALKQSSIILQRAYLGGVTVMYPIASMAHTSSIYFTVSSTFDCFFKACRTRHRCIRKLNHDRLATAAKVCPIVVIFAISYNLSRCFEMRVLPCLDDANKTTRQVCLLPLRHDPTYNAIYYQYLYTGLQVAGPLVILTLLTIYIVWSIFTNKRRRSLSGGSEAEDTPTAMVLVVILFLFCNILGLMINFLEKVKSLEYVMNYLLDISNTLVVVNSSLNFLIYLTFDLKFRRVFRRRFCSPRLAYERTPLTATPLLNGTNTATTSPDVGSYLCLHTSPGSPIGGGKYTCLDVQYPVRIKISSC